LSFVKVSGAQENALWTKEDRSYLLANLGRSIGSIMKVKEQVTVNQANVSQIDYDTKASTSYETLSYTANQIVVGGAAMATARVFTN
jgi:hypothetical protein